jgi:hypothetical protein
MEEIKDIEITDSEVKRAEAIVITDSIGMLTVKNMIDVIKTKIAKIDSHYDRIENWKKVGQWRDIKTALDNTKKVWDNLVSVGKKVLLVLDKKQKDFIRAEDKKKAEQEAKIRADLLKQAEDKKQEEMVDLILEGKTEEAKEVEKKEIKAPVVNLKTEAVIPGQSRRKNWKFRYTATLPDGSPDISKIPKEYLKLVPDEEKILAEVKRLEVNTNILGIEAYDDFTILRR